MTKKQQREIQCLEYFKRPIKLFQEVNSLALVFKDIKVTEVETGMTPEDGYFAISDRGHKNIKTTDKSKLAQLLDAKAYRLININMWEDEMGSNFPWDELFGFRFKDDKIMDRVVAEFIAKTYLQGACKKEMLACYDKELKDYNDKVIYDKLPNRIKRQLNLILLKKKRYIKVRYQNIKYILTHKFFNKKY